MYKNMSKTVHNCTMLRVIGVSKKHNSVWRVYYHDYNDDDKICLFTKKINPLLIWFYKLKKKKIHNNICENCLKEFRFYKSRFDKTPDFCFECEPEIYG